MKNNNKFQKYVFFFILIGLSFYLLLTIVQYLFIQTPINKSIIYQTDTIYKNTFISVSTKNCYNVELFSRQKLYIGIPNYVEVTHNLNDSFSIQMKGAYITSNANKVYEINVSKVGTEKLLIYQYDEFYDSVLVYEKEFDIRELPTPITNFSEIGEIKKTSLKSITFQGYIENLPIEIPCTIKSFSIIAFVGNKEIIETSNCNRFTLHQIELIDKVPVNNHLIFTDILAQLPNGKIRKIPDFIIKLK